MNKKDIFWQSYLSLEKEFVELSKYVYVTDRVTQIDKTGKVIEKEYDGLKTFSPYMCDLLVSCSSQIESISKELYFENGGSKPRDKKCTYDYVCLRYLNEKWNLDDKVVNVIYHGFDLHDEKNKVFIPLLNIYDKELKPSWDKAYQAIKHDRFNNLSQGNIFNLLNALSALYLLNIYYRNEEIIGRPDKLLGLDFSFDSKLFSINKPNMFNNVNCLEVKSFDKSSPYVSSYDEKSRNMILKLREEAEIRMREYLINYPGFSKEHIAYQEDKITIDPVKTLFNVLKANNDKKILELSTFEERKGFLLNQEGMEEFLIKNKELKLEDDDDLTKCIDKFLIEKSLINIFKIQKPDWVLYVIHKGLMKLSIE